MMIVCGLVALLVAGCTAYPTGAPDNVCNLPLLEPTFHVDNFGAKGQSNTNLSIEDKYTLTAQPVAGSPGIINVTLSGPPFKGFVLRVTTLNEENHGEFIADANTSQFNKLQCDLKDAVAVTHVNDTPKTFISLLWVDRNNGNYKLQATAVPNISSFVTNIFNK